MKVESRPHTLASVQNHNLGAGSSNATFSSSASTARSQGLTLAGYNSYSTSHVSMTNSETQAYNNVYGTTAGNITSSSYIIKHSSTGNNYSNEVTHGLSIYTTYNAVTNAANSFTNRRTQIILTTTNTGIGSVTLTTNTQGVNSVFSTSGNVSSRAFKTIFKYVSSNGSYTQGTTFETVGFSTITSSTSYSNVGTFVLNYFLTTTAGGTEWSSFLSETSQTLKNSLVLPVSTTVTVSFSGGSFLKTVLKDFNTTSTGSYVLLSNYTSPVSYSDWSYLPEAVSETVTAQGGIAKYTIDTFISRYSDPLQGAFIYQSNDLVINPYSSPRPFSQAFLSTYGAHMWTEDFESRLVGTYENLMTQGDSLDSSTQLITYKNGTTVTYNRIDSSLVEGDFPHTINSVTTQSLFAAGSEGVANHPQNLRYATQTASYISNVPETFLFTTVLKTDPLNFSTSVLSTVDYVYKVLTSTFLGSPTSTDPTPSSASSSSTSSSSFSDSNSFVTGGYSSRSASTSAFNSFASNSSSSFSHSYRLTGRFSTGAFKNIAMSQNNAVAYAIIPDYKKGYLGFSSESYYQTFSTELSISDQINYLRTSTAGHQNYNLSKFILACPEIIFAENDTNFTHYISETVLSQESFTFINTLWGRYVTGTDGVSFNEGSYTEVNWSYSFSTITSTLSYFTQKTATFLINETIVNDSLKVFYYSIVPYDSSESTFSNAMSVSLINPCSNSLNFKVQNSFSPMGGCFPNSTMEGTLFYKGLLHCTEVFLRGSGYSSSTFSLFNTLKNYESYAITHGLALAVKGKAVCYPNIGNHYELFS